MVQGNGNLVEKGPQHVDPPQHALAFLETAAGRQDGDDPVLVQNRDEVGQGSSRGKRSTTLVIAPVPAFYDLHHARPRDGAEDVVLAEIVADAAAQLFLFQWCPAAVGALRADVAPHHVDAVRDLVHECNRYAAKHTCLDDLQ